MSLVWKRCTAGFQCEKGTSENPPNRCWTRFITEQLFTWNRFGQNRSTKLFILTRKSFSSVPIPNPIHSNAHGIHTMHCILCNFVANSLLEKRSIPRANIDRVSSAGELIEHLNVTANLLPQINNAKLCIKKFGQEFQWNRFTKRGVSIWLRNSESVGLKWTSFPCAQEPASHCSDFMKLDSEPDSLAL